jgi:DNA topoisomerase-3
VCPKCKQGIVKEPNGQNFYGCSRYREGCNFNLNETIAKKTLTPKQVETLCTKGKTGLLKGFISKQGKPFEAYLTLGEETDWKAQCLGANTSPSTGVARLWFDSGIVHVGNAP